MSHKAICCSNLSGRRVAAIGPLHEAITWYKIACAGEQVAQWDLKNNATRTSPTGHAFVSEVLSLPRDSRQCYSVDISRRVNFAHFRPTKMA